MKIFFLPMSLTASIAFASASPEKDTSLKLPTFIQDTCIVDANDPFEPNMKMQRGPQKGWCVNPLKRRSVRILKDFEARPYFSSRPGTIVIANFSHKNKFWIAQIPIDSVATLRMQIEYFPIMKFPKVSIAHTQFVFDFKNGEKVLLMPQVKNIPSGIRPIELQKMIFSVENVGPFGEMFDARKGMQDYYNIAYRAVSLEEKYDWMIAEQSHKVKQLAIKLPADQVRKVLNEAISRGQRWSTSRSYNTLEPNCVSELFDILDVALDLRGHDLPWLPNRARISLAERELLDETVSLPTFNEEYEGVP
jgi:hypothetical protein